jgi:5-methyltetrahydropteroyltriglutamate--homocysteine methyltransferase
VLDTAVLLGALPARVAAIPDDLDRYFAMARGTAEVTPLEMTKWFDTNYHYLVPELGPYTQFSLNLGKPLAELRQARALGLQARPVLLGPVSFLRLAKPAPGTEPGFDSMSLLDDLLPVYAELLELLSSNGVDWVQLDEPVLATDILNNAAELAERTTAAGRARDAPSVVRRHLLRRADRRTARARTTPVEAIGIDLVTEASPPWRRCPS